MKVALGIDIGGTNTKTVLVSENGEILLSHRNPTPSVSPKSKDKLENLLVNNLKKFLNTAAAKKALADASEVSGIGIGIAGLIDRKKGTIIQSPNISSINNVPLREVFEKEFSLPVILENDANAYAFGEKWVGAGKDLENFIVLTLGTGLGGGLIYKNELYEGPVEVGHMVIVPSGRYCTCGNSGCLESYASGRAIIDRAVSSLEKGTESLLSKCCDGNIYKITPQVVYETALEGDTLSREVFREVGQFLGIGIANLINVLGLSAVIIGGGLIGGWDMFIEELSTEARKRAFKILSADLQILKTTLPEDGGSIGAAGLLFHERAGTPGQSAL
jgi:glucokinase